MDAKLLASFAYLAEVLEAHDPCTSGHLARLVEDWRAQLEATGHRLSGVLVAFYTCLEAACRDGNLARAAELVARLGAAGDALVRGSDLAQSGLACEAFVDILDAALSAGNLWKPNPEAVTIALPSEAAREKSLSALHTALERIAELVPSCHAELRETVTNIFIVRSDCMNAGSSFLTYGVIFLKELQEGQDWTAYFEHVVHEAAHHALFAIMAHHRLFSESQPDGRYASPFRRELRPLDAIYHAAFVLSRLCWALEAAQLGAFIRTYVRTARYNYENPKAIPEQFYDAYGVLLENALLTKEGREVLESAKAVVDAHL